MEAPSESSTTLTADSTGLTDGLILAMATLLITLVLELCSIPSAMAITRQKGGQRLYLTAVAMNFFNHLILGPPVYAIATSFFCRRELYPPLLSAGSCAGCVLVHALGYYTAHRAMHTREFYWAHRFHHRFNSHVSPVVANAVSFVEYLIAYILPFVLAALLFRPDGPALFATVCIVSLNNLLIHTPSLEDLSQSLVPWFAVSTTDHLEHHRRLTKNYAAPTLNIDAMLRKFATVDSAVASVFGRPQDSAAEKVE
mmetsp:Transcript_33506/g.70510  ORF Transcript_33506/g.70510 Transcript_33506/m.70510 type:complete len:255 (+) Transcript_33506:140-904(+)